MVSISAGFVAFVVGTVVTLALPVVLIWGVYKLFLALGFVLGGIFKLIGGTIRHLGRFVRGEVVDALHLAGGLVTATVILPLSVANVLIGRLAAARHYGRALEDELTSSLVSVYRIVLGHPTRLLGLAALTDGLERRLPDLVARAPRTGAVPTRRAPKERFDGYDVVREMPAGGSGARLFLARAKSERARELAVRAGLPVGDVVIKSFDARYGSTLPQIVRESRALEAAKRLGQVLEHHLDADHFYYVMPFVPGDDLDVVTRRLHAAAGDAGLDRKALTKIVGYATDLCATLERFHSEGLWHKDIKPTNLLVSGDRLQVVDLGLVTPLASALTLTTHGTEYFRDPELVRLAMRGVKVHEVDGVKFDLYSAGAVLFSMLENSFPAHGSLSRLTKPVPDALAWIVRRAMCDVNQRYGSAREMGRDLAVVLASGDPFGVRPADLPSFRRGSDDEAAASRRAGLAAAPAAAPRAQRVGSTEDRRPLSDSIVPPTAGTARRRRRRGMLAALALVGMVVCMAGGGVTVAQHRQREARSMNAQAITEHERAVASARRVAIADLDGPQRTHGDVLVYRDPQVGVGAPVDEYVARVAEYGFRPVGLSGSAREIDWLASVGRIADGVAVGDPQAVERLERWLGLHGDLTAVLWLGPGSKPGAIAGRLVAPGGLVAETWPVAEVQANDATGISNGPGSLRRASAETWSGVGAEH